MWYVTYQKQGQNACKMIGKDHVPYHGIKNNLCQSCVTLHAKCIISPPNISLLVHWFSYWHSFWLLTRQQASTLKWYSIYMYIALPMWLWNVFLHRAYCLNFTISWRDVHKVVWDKGLADSVSYFLFTHISPLSGIRPYNVLSGNNKSLFV